MESLRNASWRDKIVQKPEGNLQVWDICVVGSIFRNLEKRLHSDPTMNVLLIWAGSITVLKVTLTQGHGFESLLSDSMSLQENKQGEKER